MSTCEIKAAREAAKKIIKRAYYPGSNPPCVTAEVHDFVLSAIQSVVAGRDEVIAGLVEAIRGIRTLHEDRWTSNYCPPTVSMCNDVLVHAEELLKLHKSEETKGDDYIEARTKKNRCEICGCPPTHGVASPDACLVHCPYCGWLMCADCFLKDHSDDCYVPVDKHRKEGETNGNTN